MILAWPWFALALVLPLLVRFGLPPLRRGLASRVSTFLAETYPWAPCLRLT